MHPENQRQGEVRIIGELEKLYSIAEPMRLRMLEYPRHAARTTTELTKVLDVPYSRFYHHVTLLKPHDPIVVEKTRMVSGIFGRRCRSAIYRPRIGKRPPSAPGSGDAPLDVYLSMVLDEVATEIRRSVRSGLIDLEFTHEDAIAPRRVMIGRQWYWLKDTDVTRFQERYVEALTEIDGKHVPYADADGDPVRSDGAVLYEWLTAFYPVVPPDGGSEQ